MDDKEKIKEVYRTYWRCMIEKNADGLRGIMTEDYYLMHMTGVKQSAEVFLKGLLDGTFNYYSAEHDDIEVAVYGDRAEMTGKSRVLAEKRWPEECNKARKDCFQILACIMRGLS